MTLTNSALQRMHQALVVLGNRRMANIGADLKVARMLRALAPYAEPLESVKRAAALEIVKREVSEGVELTPTQEQILNAAIAEAQHAVDVLSVEVDLPTQYSLAEIDLPKEMSGADGWKNAAALGAILADLGPLYKMEG